MKLWHRWHRNYEKDKSGLPVKHQKCKPIIYPYSPLKTPKRNKGINPQRQQKGQQVSRTFWKKESRRVSGDWLSGAGKAETQQPVCRRWDGNMACLTQTTETQKSLEWRHQTPLKAQWRVALKRRSLGEVLQKKLVSSPKVQGLSTVARDKSIYTCKGCTR